VRPQNSDCRRNPGLRRRIKFQKGQGITYDTSPVSDGNRTAYLPRDRQIRYAVGAQYQWNERMNVGGAFEYIDLGDAKIDDPTLLTGEYEENRIFMIAFNLSHRF